MPKVNLDWIKTQFKGAGVRQGTGDAVLALLKVWETLDLTPEMAEDAIDVFSSLAKNEALIKTPAEQLWIPAQTGGMIQKGDIVRIRHNAFAGEVGIIHNGRVGRVTAIRSGDIIFRSTDDLDPFIDNAHYPFSAVEKRIR
jgi:hypothetical protein